METGSLMNLLAMRTKPELNPEVGMGVTELMWTDRHAGTITRVSESKKRLWFKRDIATRADNNGMSDAQHYVYAPNPSAPEIEARLTKKGWKIVGGSRLALGYRSEYYDYSF